MPKANLKCPFCGYLQKVEIPLTGCLAFHRCEKCQKLISVPEGQKECCVICAYSDQKCFIAQG